MENVIMAERETLERSELAHIGVSPTIQTSTIIANGVVCPGFLSS